MTNFKLCVVSLMTSISLAACGGGGEVFVGVSTASAPFISWAGSSGVDHVIDGLGHQFAFRSDTGCLYNFQTGGTNAAFCLVSGNNVVTYGAFQGQVVNVLITDGSCHAAIIDSFTGNFSDIELDQFGREVVLVTSLHPALCR